MTLDLLTMLKLDINKFSFGQLTSNASGKTSASGTMGVFVTFLSTIAFLYGCYEFHVSQKADVMMYASANILVGASLLGYRKSREGTGTDLTVGNSNLQQGDDNTPENQKQ